MNRKTEKKHKINSEHNRAARNTYNQQQIQRKMETAMLEMLTARSNEVHYHQHHCLKLATTLFLHDHCIYNRILFIIARF